MSNSGWNMYVFRNGREAVSGSELVSSLTHALGLWRGSSKQDSEDRVLAALIAAGELECALLDSVGEGGPSESCDVASEITESLANAFLSGQRHSYSSILQKLQHLRVADRYEVAVQEGFAYYALHPRKVAFLLDSLELRPCMAVVGIRSIGLTLSAVACASLRLRGVDCRRITVRPTGHPYNRKLELTPELCDWVASERDAGFLIIDEGPGISGSSFLAAAEALENCGVESARIQMIGSREVDPAALRAENASGRWSRYRFQIMQNAPIPPPESGESLSGGAWRRHFHCSDSNMPASWAPLEPAKFLSIDHRSIFKFEGFGHYGEEVGSRAKVLADRGFSPRYLGNRSGFGQYELVAGCALDVSDWSPELSARVADYLTLRLREFATNARQSPEIEKMLRWNWQVEFKEEIGSAESELLAAHIVVCDGCMSPHKWLRTDSGDFLKLDACRHGDSHFFPGPCDIAWDVAGTIVEWELHGEVRERFVREYVARSGDAIADRLAPYLLSYVTFRMGWSKMAAVAMQGEFDEPLLARDHARYRTLALALRQELNKLGASETTERATDANSFFRSA